MVRRQMRWGNGRVIVRAVNFAMRDVILGGSAWQVKSRPTGPSFVASCASPQHETAVIHGNASILHYYSR